MTARDDSEACKLTPCGNPLGATSGRSQACEPSPQRRQAASEAQDQASDAARSVVPQGVAPAQPAGPAGGPAEKQHPARDGDRERGSPPSVDTSEVSRPSQPRSALQMDYVRALEAPTKNHRARRAQKYREQAACRQARLRNAGEWEGTVEQSVRWHLARARAQEDRIRRVLACGATVLEIICQGCGLVHERTEGCGAALYCVHCRGVIAAEKRGRFLAARASVLEEAADADLLNPRRRGGQYIETMFTPTVPHLRTDTPIARIDRALNAWGPFLKQLNRHWRERVITHAEWFRVVEWTVGVADSLGNPHLHIWLFSPFVHIEDLREMWRRALLTGGCPPEACQRPVVHIRRVDDEHGGVLELIKYLTKDIMANGKKVPPELYAQVIEAFEGRRQTQGSKGFMARADKAAPACECGSTLPKRTRRLRSAGSETPSVEPRNP
jgi:hypothetical protein